MKPVCVMISAACAVAAQAQEQPIYRCGNEYTNTRPDANTRGCRLVSGGNITVVQGTSVHRTPTDAPRSPHTVPRPSANDRQSQKKNSDARLILLSELEKAQARQKELQQAYNHGEPTTDDATDRQKYQNRVAELRSSLARNESDIAGIRRELDRIPTDDTNPTPSVDR